MYIFIVCVLWLGVCAPDCSCPWRPKEEGVRFLKLELYMGSCELGSELRSSERTANALSYCTVFPGPHKMESLILKQIVYLWYLQNFIFDFKMSLEQWPQEIFGLALESYFLLTVTEQVVSCLAALLLRFIFMYVCLCWEHVHVSTGSWEQQRLSVFLDITFIVVVSCLIRVLGTELWKSSERES